MIDATDEPWISDPGIENVSIEIKLARPSTVNKIFIRFNLKPDTFDLFFIKKGGVKLSYMRVSGNEED